MRLWLGLVVGLLTGGKALGAVPSCSPDREGRVDLEQCAAEAPAGSPERRWALINLGTQALQRGDFATAVRLYDQAQPAAE